jgi:translation initiation factor 1
MGTNLFDKLKALRDALPPGPQKPAATAATATPDSPASERSRKISRAVLRYERKGRGGREVTLIEHTGLSASDLDQWCRDARKAFGCGGTVEGDAIVLHGDQRTRLPPWLEARGVKKVTASG